MYTFELKLIRVSLGYSYGKYLKELLKKQIIYLEGKYIYLWKDLFYQQKLLFDYPIELFTLTTRKTHCCLVLLKNWFTRR